jgi:LemA protein
MSFDISVVLTIAGILVGISILSYVVILFNNYIILKNLINKAQANIDVLLKQRFDELPKLINSVKGYMKYESQILTQITQQRTQIMSGNIDTKAIANNYITNALKSIFAVAENYPELKANENFIQLQQRISSIESEISQRRVFYNETVNRYNIWRESFPNNILAKVVKATKKDLFETQDKKDVEVKF